MSTASFILLGNMAYISYYNACYITCFKGTQALCSTPKQAYSSHAYIYEYTLSLYWNKHSLSPNMRSLALTPLLQVYINIGAARRHMCVLCLLITLTGTAGRGQSWVARKLAGALRWKSKLKVIPIWLFSFLFVMQN
jgi:hypothetical protein